MTLLFGFFFLLYIGQDEGKKEISAAFNMNRNVFPKKIEKNNAEIEKARLFLFPCRLCMSWDRDRNQSLKKALNLPEDGLLIADIIKEGPADKAGLKELDLVTSVNGKQATYKLMDQLLFELGPDETIIFKVIRNNNEISIPVKLDLFEARKMKLESSASQEENLIADIYGRKFNDVDRIKNYIPRHYNGWIVTKITQNFSSNLKIGDFILDFKATSNKSEYALKVLKYQGPEWIVYKNY